MIARLGLCMKSIPIIIHGLFCGRCPKIVRVILGVLVFLGLSVVHSYFVWDLWRARSNSSLVLGLEELGFSYTYITNVMATMAACMIIVCILSIVEAQLNPKRGYWMVGVIFSFHSLQLAWLGFWRYALVSVSPDMIGTTRMWIKILGGTLGGASVLLLGGRVWEFLKGVGVCSALTFAFVGTIALCRTSLPQNWKCVVEDTGLSSRISLAIFCLFFAGATALAALLYAYLPCRCNCCFIRERCAVVLFGVASLIFAGGVAGVLLPRLVDNTLAYSASECNSTNVADWGRCPSGDVECCSVSGHIMWSLLKDLLGGIVVGSWVFAVIAIIGIIRTAVAEKKRCMANVPDLYEVEVYEDGELLRTVLTRTHMTRDWGSAVDKGVSV